MTLDAPPTLDRLIDVAAMTIHQAEVVRVNALTGEPTYGPTYTFVVGGNILARGLTINDLLVTYYLREAKTPQMDTVWQHARMYGYREAMMAYTRVYLPSHLASLFREIHQSENELRSLVAKGVDVSTIPILTPSGTRPTRPGAVERAALKVYGGDDVQQIYPYYFVVNPDAVGQTAARIHDILQRNNVPLQARDRAERLKQVSLATVRDIVHELPLLETDDGRWDRDGVVALLDATAETYGEDAFIYARAFEGENPGRRRVTGVLSGEEVAIVQATQKFVLALVYLGPATGPSAWYPTVVVPKDLPPHVFNPLT
jgi:hypothetical protein